MIEEYQIHNLFRKNIEHFLEHDPHLSQLQEFRFVHPLRWWQKLDFHETGIYLLTGGRQIGKTTSTKLLLKELLLSKKISPQSLFYLPCDQIDTHLQLGRTLRDIFQTFPPEHFVLIIDEVTFVKDWDRAIKALADEGWFRKGTCIITGSDSIILKEAAARFPGRRGRSAHADFHLHPLSFREYVGLTRKDLLVNPDLAEAGECFQSYLQCGGFLRAINDLHHEGKIRAATYATFEQWIQGDFAKRGKSLHTLEGVLKTILETTGSQVTHSSLTQRMGEVSKETFIDYYHLLERMDVVFSLQAFDQNKKIGFPKKARKFHFCDPFIMHTVERWLLDKSLISMRENTESILAEAVTAASFYRNCPTYYWKSKGEIDVLYLKEKKTHALEVKWGEQLRPWDINELKKFKQAQILTKQHEGQKDGIPIIPLPLFLLQEERK